MNMFGKLSVGTAMIAAVSFGAIMASADTASSTNFRVLNPVSDTSGSHASSTSFQHISAEGQTVIGESTSTSFIVRAGFLYFDTFAPRSQNWRWYQDEASETPVIPLADENVAPSNIDNQNVIALRISVAETAGLGSQNVKFKLQFSENSDFSGAVYDVVESGSCTGNSLWCYADGGGSDGGLITTRVLSDADACVAGIGAGCGTHNESASGASAVSQASSTVAEYEFTVRDSGAQTNTTYFFRLFDTVNGTPVPTNTGESYPSLLTEGTALSVSLSGLPNGTSTGGIVTDATSTATAVSFGNLPVGTEREAAQRLTVTTNASAGYQVLVVQDASLLNAFSDSISGVSSTNAAPLSWSAGCPLTLSGCYGYHTTDATLAGGSTRFAASDTYARFGTTTEEIAYSSGPVTDEVTDLVFKIKVTGSQEDGQYQNAVAYIIAPVF